MFVSYEFIQNVVEYSMGSFGNWTDIVYGRGNSRFTPILQFRVADH